MMFQLTILFSTYIIVQVLVGADMAPITLDDIVEAKAARLMKSKEDIDVQSTFHEDEIPGTGDVSDEFAARLVRNKGPITAKVTAATSHSRYCSKDSDHEGDCAVRFSLVAWKFAGDNGIVRGTVEEQFEDGTGLTIDVDCMTRKDNEAIVGGVVMNASDRHPVGTASGRRAYVKVVDHGSSGMDMISNIIIDDGINSHCNNYGMSDKFVMTYENNDLEPRVSVCAKRGGENCSEKSIHIIQAVQ